MIIMQYIRNITLILLYLIWSILCIQCRFIWDLMDREWNKGTSWWRDYKGIKLTERRIINGL